MHPNLRYARKPLRGFGIVFVCFVGMGIFLATTAKPLDYKTIKIAVGRQTVHVSHASGAKKHGLLVMEGDTVTWCRDEGGSFLVEFKHGSPFQGGLSKFVEKDCNNPDSPPVIQPSNPSDNDVYKYDLTVDGKKFDPHVIIVGGGPDSPPSQ